MHWPTGLEELGAGLVRLGALLGAGLIGALVIGKALVEGDAVGVAEAGLDLGAAVGVAAGVAGATVVPEADLGALDVAAAATAAAGIGAVLHDAVDTGLEVGLAGGVIGDALVGARLIFAAVAALQEVAAQSGLPGRTWSSSPLQLSCWQVPEQSAWPAPPAPPGSLPPWAWPPRGGGAALGRSRPAAPHPARRRRNVAVPPWAWPHLGLAGGVVRAAGAVRAVRGAHLLLPSRQVVTVYRPRSPRSGRHPAPASRMDPGPNCPCSLSLQAMSWDGEDGAAGENVSRSASSPPASPLGGSALGP